MAKKGVELASAYISLSVTTDKVPEQIEDALKGSRKTTERMGRDLGDKLSSSMGGSVSKSLAKELGQAGDKASKELLRELASGHRQAERNAAIAGQRYAKALASSMKGGSKDAALQYEREFREALNARNTSQVFFDQFHADGVRRGKLVGTLVGKAIGGAITLALTAATAGATAAVGAIGVTLFKGFERYKSLDASAKRLGKLGRNADQVREIMSDINDVVEGTPISLDAATEAATNFITAGMEGDELKKTLSAIADAAGASGSDFSELATIFGQVNNKGKLMGEELQQLAEHGLNVMPLLKEHFKDLPEDVADAGLKIGDLVDVIEGKFGGMAKSAADTVDGALSQMQTAVARVGANFLSAIFGDPLSTTEGPGAMAEAINKVTAKIDDLNAWVKEHQGEIKQFFTDASETVKDLWNNLKEVGTWMVNNKETIGLVGAAFGAWKVAGLIGDLKLVSAMLGTAGAAGAGGTGILGQLGLAAALAGTVATVTAGGNGDQQRLGALGLTLGGAAAGFQLGGPPGAIAGAAIGGAGAITGAIANDHGNFADEFSKGGRGTNASGPPPPGYKPQNPLDALTGAPATAKPGTMSDLFGTAASGGGGGSGLDDLLGTVSGGPNFARSQQTPYGLPGNTNSGGYGHGDKEFPPWVHQIAATFGIKPSTYPGHQTSNRNEPGYAPNPSNLNRGIDWTGPPENLQRFADYLATIPGALEQVIWQNPATGRATEIAGGRPQPGYFSGDLGQHQNHVHTRQSMPIPLPPWAQGMVTGGGVSGPGGIDNVPAWLTAGEHVLTRDDVAAMGGQAGVYAFRNALHRAGGGEIPFTLGQVNPTPDPPGLGRPIGKRPGFTPPRKPGGGYPGVIGLPDWGVPGTEFGPPPDDWWLKPVNPDSILFPEWMPPGLRELWKEHWKKKRIKPLHRNTGGAIGADSPGVRDKTRGFFGGRWRRHHDDKNRFWNTGQFNPDLALDPSHTSIAPRLTPSFVEFTERFEKDMGRPAAGWWGGMFGQKYKTQAGAPIPWPDSNPGFNTGGEILPGHDPWPGGLLADLYSPKSAMNRKGLGLIPSESTPVVGNFNPNIQLDTSTTGIATPISELWLPIQKAMLSDMKHRYERGWWGIRPGVTRKTQDSAPIPWPDSDRRTPGFAEGGAVDPNLFLQALAGGDQHGQAMGLPIGPDGPAIGEGGMFMPPQQDQGLGAGVGRTEGYIPAGAGFSGKTGGGLAGGLIALGGEAAKGAIQMAADLGKMAASAAASSTSFGAGAAAGPAAGAGIQIAADIAKRGVDYGVDMANIGIGALTEILSPFGAPRWLADVDATSFMPNMGGGSIFTTAAEALQQGMGPGKADPNGTQHGQAQGAPPGPGPVPPGTVPPGPVGPTTGAGGAPASPPPAVNPPNSQNPTPATPAPNDPLGLVKDLGIFDTGGVLQPNSGAINLSRRPEYVFTQRQLDAMEANAAVGGQGNVTYQVYGNNLDEALRELKKHERRQSGPIMRGKAGR